MIFVPAEYTARLEAVRASMAAPAIDVLVVDAVEPLAYLAGWHASGSLYHACLVPRAGDPVVVCRRLDEPAFRERSWQLAVMRPGAADRGVDRVCREGVLKAGLRETYDHFTGDTLGYYGTPLIAPRSSDFTRAFLPTAEWALEPGMVFHMYTGARGMAFSETVLVTERGPERLTRLERRLFVQ